MSPNKPSKNEDEYFAKRGGRAASRRSASGPRPAAEEAARQVHFMKCPKDGHDLVHEEFHGVDGGPLRCTARASSSTRTRSRRWSPGTTPRCSDASSAISRGVARARPGVEMTAVVPVTRAASFPGERPVTMAVVREHNLTPVEYDRDRRDARPHADAHRARGLLRALVRALLVQALQAGPAALPDHRAAGRAGARRERRRAAPSRTAGRSPSRSSRTTTPPRWSRTRAPPPASAASCATSSPWAPGRWRCSTSSASARSTEPRNRYLFAGVVRGVGDYGNCIGVPTLGRRSRLCRRVLRQPPGQRHVRRHPARGRPRHRAGRTASATCCSTSAPRPGATASTAPASPPRNSPKRARPGVRRCRSATRSPRSSSSRPASN